MPARAGQARYIRGRVVYDDWCSRRVWAMTTIADLWEKHKIGQFDFNLSAFGEDEAGELYLTDMANGRVMRLHFANAAE